MRVLLGASALLFSTLANAQTVVCESGSWHGVTTYFSDIDAEPSADRVALPSYTYTIDQTSTQANRRSASGELSMAVLHRYRNYTVLGAVEGGVLYTDTVFDTGLVISQYAKSMMGTPVASTFRKQCSIQW